MCVNYPTALVQRDWGETKVLDRRNPILLLTDQHQNHSMRKHAWFEAFQARYSEPGDADPHARACLEHDFLESVTSAGDVEPSPAYVQEEAVSVRQASWMVGWLAVGWCWLVNLWIDGCSLFSWDARLR